MITKHMRFTQQAQAAPTLRFTALMGLLSDREELLASFQRQSGQKAKGVDGIGKQDYAKGLDERLVQLSERLRRLGYRPQPVRRVYIPKGNGKVRPLGIPSFEDRLVQDRLSRILQAIWEPEFCDCSYGFRPGRSAHDALRRINEVIKGERTQWVVEADIKGFFDNVDHEHLMRFLAHRINDPMFLRIIRRFLKAGVMEGGEWTTSESGTPQGGLVSPVLANVYLHYVLDLWFEKRYAKACRGTARLVRYADDFVVCFQDEEDAKEFIPALRERLSQFELELEPSKTKLIRFGDRADWHRPGSVKSKPPTFNFLGLTHYVRRSRRGYFVIGRLTERRRYHQKLKQLNQQLKVMRHKGGRTMVTTIQRHLEGHIRYYGVSGNSRRVQRYIERTHRLLFKWLNRRSQRRSLNWEEYRDKIGCLLPKARIVHCLYT